MYQERTYRNLIRNGDFTPFQVSVKETDLCVKADNDLKTEARDAVLKYRNHIEEYIRCFPEFQRSLVPLPIDPFAPGIVKSMIKASNLAGVGPMAAVAGAISEFVGKELLKLSKNVIVENGGDIFLKTSSYIRISIYAGTSPLSNKIGIKINPDDTPLGVCTSSGTVGHSVSFGKADAVTVISRSALLADAAATSIGNLIKDKGDFNKGLEYAGGINGVIGALIIFGKKMAIRGDIELVEL